MPVSYTKYTWPTRGLPGVSAARLQNIEDGVANAVAAINAVSITPTYTALTGGGAAPTPVLSAVPIQVINRDVTLNQTMGAPALSVATAKGSIVVFVLTQDVSGGVGNFTLAWNATYKLKTAMTLTITANKTDIIAFIADPNGGAGSGWYELFRNQNI